MIDWIDDNLAIGGWMEALNEAYLVREGIDIVYDVRPLFYDGWPKVDALLDEVDKIRYLSLDHTILLRCMSGKDRAPFVATVYMHLKYGMSWEDAYDYVKSRRAKTVFHWDWVDALENGWA